MPLIAITREMGALGDAVANGLGEALGLPVIYHEIIDYLADKMRLRKSHVIKLIEGRASFLEKLTADQTSLSIFTAAETFALASRVPGAVLLSWGAANLLNRVPHAIRVRVCAPEPLRAGRLKQRLGTEDDEYVAHEIRASDEAHAAIIRRHFGVDWRDAELYDLVLNTGRLGVAECVEHLLAAVRSPTFEESVNSRTRLEQLGLEAHVRGALRHAPETTRLRITIGADDGRIVLAGAVPDQRDAREAVRVASAVPGVKSVEDRMTSATATRHSNLG